MSSDWRRACRRHWDLLTSSSTSLAWSRSFLCQKTSVKRKVAVPALQQSRSLLSMLDILWWYLHRTRPESACTEFCSFVWEVSFHAASCSPSNNYRSDWVYWRISQRIRYTALCKDTGDYIHGDNCLSDSLTTQPHAGQFDLANFYHFGMQDRDGLDTRMGSSIFELWASNTSGRSMYPISWHGIRQ